MAGRLDFNRSVEKTVLLSLVSVTTLLLALFGTWDYLSEKAHLLEELRRDMSTITGQLSTSLSGPMWYLERGQVVLTVEGVMQNERVSAILVREANTPEVYLGRVRDASWRSVSGDSLPAGRDDLSETRAIVHDGATLGTVEVSLTTRFARRALRRSLIFILVRILGLNLALTVVMAMILRRVVFAPLAGLTRYAALVRSRLPGDEALRAGSFKGELEQLRRAMEEMVGQLSAAERKYRDIFENATEGIFQTSLGGCFLSANAALARMIGYDTPEELMGQVTNLGQQLYYDPADRERLLDLLMETGAVTGFQTRFVRRDRQTIWVLINVRLVRDAAGAPAYIEGTNTDATARIRAERRLQILNRHLREAVKERTRRLAQKASELEEANVRLKELDRLKSGFLSTVSHDLRTPLTSIMGFAKLISRDFNKSFTPLCSANERLARHGQRIVGNLAIIASEGERLTRLVNDFLDLSKIEAGRAEWRDNAVDVEAAIAQAAKAISGDLDGKPEVALDLEVEPGLPPLFMDPDRLSQVLVNLLGNAVKFTDTGTVSLRARASEGMVRVEVADTGPGIPPESLERIFDKFHQAVLGDTVDERRRRKGTGLGLAICRQIVGHYQGRIWAESELGQGSTFVVTLPPGAWPEAD